MKRAQRNKSVQQNTKRLLSSENQNRLTGISRGITQKPDGDKEDIILHDPMKFLEEEKQESYEFFKSPSGEVNSCLTVGTFGMTQVSPRYNPGRTQVWLRNMTQIGPRYDSDMSQV